MRVHFFLNFEDILSVSNKIPFNINQSEQHHISRPFFQSMSRLRRFNRKVLRGIGSDSDNDEITFLPLDSDEQEELINRFEVRSQSKDNQYIQLLSVAYLICCGLFILLLVRLRRKEDQSTNKRLALFSINSIVSSLIYLRYEIAKNFEFFKYRFQLTTKRINTLNCILLLLITWQVTEEVNMKSMQFLFHIPLLLFVVTFLTRKWIRDLDRELDDLRGLKYKFKNA